MHCLFSLFLTGLVTLFSTSAVLEAALPAIQEVKNPKVQRSVFKTAKRNQPIKITSLKDAAKHLQKETLEQIKKEVNFQKQFVLIFAWQGSGGDRLKFDVAESFPEQIFFSIQPGLTDDLRSHVRVFVLRSNVRFKVR